MLEITGVLFSFDSPAPYVIEMDRVRDHLPAGVKQLDIVLQLYTQNRIGIISVAARWNF